MYRCIQSGRTVLRIPLRRNKNNNPNIKRFSNKPPTKQHVEPELKIDPKEGNSILHQKAARAAELHAELNALLDAQAKRRADEMNRPFGAGFLDFMKKNKSEMINIFAAFTCVLLAWQISNIRKGARKLLDDAAEKEIKMEELKKILRVLSEEEFAANVAKSHVDKLKSSRNDLNEKKKSWFFSRYAENQKDDSELSTDVNIVLKTVIQNELRKTIGDAALSSYEKEQNKLLSLQHEMGLIENSKDPGKSDSESSLEDLEKILGVVEMDKGNSDQTVVKRKGFI